MKILLLGKNGQVGSELARSLAPVAELVCLGRDEANFMDESGLIALVKHHNPDIVVNAVAYTAVDKAETDEDTAYQVNASAVKALAEEAASAKRLFVHYSTDYVYDGQKDTPYHESDACGPLGVYGKSKVAGEEAIIRAGGLHLIFRTSWVYGSHGHNFGKTILRLARARDQLRVVGDQFGAPTNAALIADVTSLILHQYVLNQDALKDKTGVYHLVGGGKTSWHGFATALVEEATKAGIALKCQTSAISSIATHEYPLPAPRPMNSCLSTQKIYTSFGIMIPEWTYYLSRFVRDLKEGEFRES